MVPKFKTTEVTPSETLGEKLKKIREGLKLSLADVEKSTKIQKKYIKAIEENDYNSLPADVYTKGFLSNYSKILRIDGNKVLEIYKKERGIIDNIQQTKKPRNINKLKSPKFIITPKSMLVFLAVILAFGIISYIGYEIFILTSSPKLQIISPVDNSVIKKNFIDITGKTDEGADVYINGQKVNISEAGDFKINVGIGQKGVNVIKIVAKNNKNGKTTEKITNVIAEISEVSLPNQPATPELLNNVKVTLKIDSGTAWISLVKDGNKDFEGIMLPGTIRDFEAKDKIILTTGNAGSTEVIFNGKSLGKIGGDGEVKTDLVFDQNTKVE
ncbi:hypothetical protein AUJ93_00585 [bacterium CG2_30_33_46]|nr:MAG: hypothetical protein AUJ93_00585 [bacterium CG2_30_33_46]